MGVRRRKRLIFLAFLAGALLAAPGRRGAEPRREDQRAAKPDREREGEGGRPLQRDRDGRRRHRGARGRHRGAFDRGCEPGARARVAPRPAGAARGQDRVPDTACEPARPGSPDRAGDARAPARRAVRDRPDGHDRDPPGREEPRRRSSTRSSTRTRSARRTGRSPRGFARSKPRCAPRGARRPRSARTSPSRPRRSP